MKKAVSMAAILCLLLFVYSIGGCDSTPADPYDEPILTETGESTTDADITTEIVPVTTTETSVATTKSTTATSKETTTTTKATTAATKTTTETTKSSTVSEVTVWIPQSGSKYHSSASCSNMKNPSQVTKSRAIEMGYSACKRCYN